MGIRRLAGSVVGSVMMALAITGIAVAASAHTYSVSLTLKAELAAHRLSGTVVSKAPYEMCELSKIRIRRVLPGKDEVVARVKPAGGGEWHLKSPPSLKGARIYTEVSRYQLPKRPVVCLGARSRIVTAP